MKKLIYILICVLLTAALAVTVFAAENAEMTLDTAEKTVTPGETVAFTVTLGAMEDCASAGFTLSYDETVFEFLDGSCTAKDTLISSLKDGTGVFTYGDPRPVSGEIFAFQLKVKDSATVGSYSITAKGSVRNADGAVSTKVNGVSVAVAVETDEPTTTPAIGETAPPKETEPAPKETLPVKQTEPADEEIMPTEMQTEPAVSEATIPENATEPVPKETKPAMDTPMVPPETAVHTIGAAPEAQRAGFPWWTLAVAVVILAAGGAALYKRRK